MVKFVKNEKPTDTKMSIDPKHKTHEENYTKENHKLFKTSDKEKTFETTRWKIPCYRQMNNKNNGRLLSDKDIILKTVE